MLAGCPLTKAGTSERLIDWCLGLQHAEFFAARPPLSVRTTQTGCCPDCNQRDCSCRQRADCEEPTASMPCPPWCCISTVQSVSPWVQEAGQGDAATAPSAHTGDQVVHAYGALEPSAAPSACGGRPGRQLPLQSDCRVALRRRFTAGLWAHHRQGQSRAESTR